MSEALAFSVWMFPIAKALEAVIGGLEWAYNDFRLEKHEGSDKHERKDEEGGTDQ